VGVRRAASSVSISRSCNTERITQTLLEWITRLCLELTSHKASNSPPFEAVTKTDTLSKGVRPSFPGFAARTSTCPRHHPKRLCRKAHHSETSGVPPDRTPCSTPVDLTSDVTAAKPLTAKMKHPVPMPALIITMSGFRWQPYDHWTMILSVAAAGALIVLSPRKREAAASTTKSGST
jgi:hypothetical protein